MTQQLDDTTLVTLYHALGANLSQGLELFEAAFVDAAADYRLKDMDALLDLLADPTLQDDRRLAWHGYYTARKALLQWQPQEIEKSLQEIEVGREDAPALQPRLELLRGQVEVMRGEWAAGLATLKQVSSAFRSAGERALLAEVKEWTARAFISRAQNCGGWADFPRRGPNAWLRAVLTIVSLPLYAPLLIYLWATGAREFWRPTLRYGANHSNWPIFIYYLRAFRALARASQAAPTSDPETALRLRIMQADLLRRLPAPRAAAAAYQALLDALPAKEVNYQAALLKHGLAQVLLDLNEVESAQSLLKEARAAYDELNDARAVAHIDLLQGDAAIRAQSPESALSLWERSLGVFEEQQDAVGLAEGLGRCYAILEDEPGSTLKDRALALIHHVKRQVFVVRMPNRLFDLLQLMGWVIPILVTLGLMAYAAYFILQYGPTEFRQMARAILSLQGILVAGGIVLAATILNTMLGLLGLASTLRQEATRLDFIAIDKTAVRRYNFAGREQESLAWSEIKHYIRVERGLWRKPTPTLSFDYLRATASQAMRLPGTTAWFGHLQREVESYLGRPPQRYRLRWYGGVFIGLMGFIFALSYVLMENVIPGVSAAAHAWLASLLLAGSYIGLSFVTGHWILHYVRVAEQVSPSSRFVPVAGLLGVFLVGLGAFGRRILFFTSSLAVFWGVVLLLGLATGLRRRQEGPPWRRPLVAAVGGTTLIAGCWLVLRALLPVLLVTQAFTYSRAIHNLDPNQAGYDTQRAKYFERMGQAGKWMVTLDPAFYQGYGYMGYDHYFRGDYETSTRAYSQAIRFGGSIEFFYCRALAYHALGDNVSAERDLEFFAKHYPPDKTPGCQSLFPETARVFD